MNVTCLAKPSPYVILSEVEESQKDKKPNPWNGKNADLSPQKVNYASNINARTGESRDGYDSRIRNQYAVRRQAEEDATRERLQSIWDDMQANNKAGHWLRSAAENLPRSDGQDTIGLSENVKKSPRNIAEKIKNIVSKFNEYKPYNRRLDAASMAFDDNDVLDDVTNTLFKAYDFVQNSKMIMPIVFKTAPLKAINDTAHSVLARNNYNSNSNIDLKVYEENHNGYINDQNTTDSKMKELKYGVWDMYNNGCELIAVYNTLNTLSANKDIRDIAEEFETKGQTLYGLFGTSPYAVGDYFRERGYDVKTYEGDDTIDNLNLPEADSYILSFWNSNRVSKAIHTVSISKQPDGYYKIYNSDGQNAEIVDDLHQYLFEKRKYGRRVPLVLHCISKKGRKE